MMTDFALKCEIMTLWMLLFSRYTTKTVKILLFFDIMFIFSHIKDGKYDYGWDRNTVQ